MSARLKVRLRKSPISYTQETRGTLRALGLRRINDMVDVPDNPATRGMVRAVRFLVDVEEIAPLERPRAHASKAAHADAAERAPRSDGDEPAPSSPASGAEEERA
jgi:large subunit ribosomal protein L30